MVIAANGVMAKKVGKADPADPRPDATKPGAATPDWGLHLIDLNIAMGSLVDLAEGQGKTWRARK